MKKKSLILLLVIILLFTIGITSFIYSSYKVFDVKTLMVDVTVREENKTLGFNVDTDAIHFGELPRNTGGGRTIHINNTYGKEAFIVIKMRGEMSEWITITPNNFVLEPDERRDITFKIEIPKNASIGNHTGFVNIQFLRN
ncbi:MAG: hypothetical protein KJ583_00990 [Nanoarchaeota archaeon]|nr:hypothetical protein [Nanoarchaeota archaeon]MBU1270488.1 hypothetical protein [Nanoarchaeota archaeon]MBU1603866.1 hypothetical protein [Nanoarchaeota archaeon]MBU2442717.1 hypothetical protein [Nanoarchaeota archaeon]